MDDKLTVIMVKASGRVNANKTLVPNMTECTLKQDMSIEDNRKGKLLLAIGRLWHSKLPEFEITLSDKSIYHLVPLKDNGFNLIDAKGNKTLLQYTNKTDVDRGRVFRGIFGLVLKHFNPNATTNVSSGSKIDQVLENSGLSAEEKVALIEQERKAAKQKMADMRQKAKDKKGKGK
jgi:hypothetical protein